MVKANNQGILRSVYNRIKESVISYQLPPGERLNIEILAERFQVSATPVRESLNRLVAEDLIILIPKTGFFMKDLREPELRDLYELNSVLLDWSIARIANNCAEGVEHHFPEISTIGDKLMQQAYPYHRYLVKSSGNLFADMARKSGNNEVNLRVRSINDKLYYIRCCEFEMQHESKEQVLTIFQLYRNDQYQELRTALLDYHDTRLKLLPSILRAKNITHKIVLKKYETNTVVPISKKFTKK